SPRPALHSFPTRRSSDLYARSKHPELRLHLSVQVSATNYKAIQFYVEHFGISRVVLPRVLSITQVEQVCEQVPAEVEVFGFGSRSEEHTSELQSRFDIVC